MEEKYIGLILALSSSVLIGVSFIFTKLGLQDASKNVGSAGDHYEYFKRWKWWLGLLTMIGGEAANFAAYSFAPALLVTPLGAGSVILGAILASVFLKEELGTEGKLGCTLSIIGAIVIVLHAPEEKDITSVDEILELALHPGFLVYTLLTVIVTAILIVKVAPRYGKTNMLIYIAICSLAGSITVTAAKALGIALKLTFAGKNQFNRLPTYVFILIVVASVIIQLNYFNKALDIFSTNRVTPIYYVFFTTATIVASIILFQGFNDASYVSVLSNFCGFITIFVGVFLLNSHRDPAAPLSAVIVQKSRRGSRSSFRMISTSEDTSPDAYLMDPLSTRSE